MTYRPSALVFSRSSWLVSVLMTVTVASGTPAPEESTTVPESRPAVVCAVTLKRKKLAATAAIPADLSGMLLHSLTFSDNRHGPLSLDNDYSIKRPRTPAQNPLQAGSHTIRKLTLIPFELAL